MDLIKVIRSRRAVREYTPDAVDEATLRDLVELAVQAPNAMNRQPWSFCIIRDQDLLQRISDEAKAQVLRSAPDGHPLRQFEQMLGDPEFQIFYHAPVLVLISATEDDKWSRIDCALAAENLMLAACAAGLGSCWIGFAQGWLATEPGKAAIGIPNSHIPVAPIIVGHPKGEAQPVSRNEPEIQWIG